MDWCFMKILDGCYVEYAPDEVVNPVRGTNRGSIEPVESKPYQRQSTLDEIPDDFVARMMGYKEVAKKRIVEPEHPTGFTVSVAYNKGGSQVIPANDLNDS